MKKYNNKVLKFNAKRSLPTTFEVEQLILAKSISCIIIENLFTKEYCTNLINIISKQKRSHDRLKGVFIVGNTFYQAFQGGNMADEYFSSSNDFAIWLRKCSSGLSPLDVVMGLFSMINEKGVSKAYLSDKREMPQGIFRMYPADYNPEILPHQDVLQWYIDDSVAQNLLGQIGWNIYLDIPSSGGELVLYDKHLDKEEYDSLSKGDYGIPWDKVEYRNIFVSPRIGDLILIDSTRLHAIKKVSGTGDRVTLSGFLGYDNNKTLISWA
jgi:hypothetical protein